MPYAKLPKVHSMYGAPLGRPEIYLSDRQWVGRIRVARVALNQGGYDHGGAYWGGGERLWRVRGVAPDGGEDLYEFVRSDYKHVVVEMYRERYPNANVW